MAIDFNQKRWERIKTDSHAWWRGELGRPLVQFTAGGRDPGRPEPAVPNYYFTAFYDFSVSAEDIIDRWDYDFSRTYYLGDAFPWLFPNFGPGVVAAFLGAELHTSIEGGTVWFHPKEELDIRDLHFSYDPDNIWLNRVKDICRAAADRWQGMVQISMTDLGGALDLLSIFRPSEKLLFDLYDYPEDVKRLTWEIHELWWRYFEEINEVLQPSNPGYTAWAPVFSETPTYMLQCDFAYMISPAMFDEFAMPELAASSRKLSNAFYHLDGPGELPHLDSLCSIPELKGIQWGPGAGAPDCSHWPEVYRKIRDAGKLALIFGGPDELDAIADQLGNAEGLILVGCCEDRDRIKACLKRYNAE
ncbi:MAG: hypothetical protein ABFD64_10430 [Armatimonadota bacterium]